MYGIEAKEIKHYHTDSCGGQFENGIGWEVLGAHKDGSTAIFIMNPEGFEATVYEILETAKKKGWALVYPSRA